LTNSATVNASPLHPRALLLLVSRPDDFFRLGAWDIGSNGVVLGLAWLYGVAAVIERLNSRLAQVDLRATFGTPRPADAIVLEIASDWSATWLLAAVMGVISAAIYLSAGGWFYGVRLRWCGVEDPDWWDIRGVYMWSGLIYAVAQIVSVVIEVAVYPNYLAAWRAAGWEALLPVAGAIGAVVVSWRGVRSRWPQARADYALLWFLLLPGFFPVVGGALVALALIAAWLSR
jgi:hypothetical protein